MSIASRVSPVTFTAGNFRDINGDYVFQREYVDKNATYGALANAYQNAAENSLQQMINAAQNAANKVNNSAVNGSISDINGTVSDVKGYAGQMSGVASQIGTQAGAVNDWAAKVGQTANALTPYAQSMKDYASSVYGQGKTLVDQGNALLGTWGNFAPLVGQYTSALKSLDPNNQVSMAASDVQRSYQNTQGQNQRAMARMGVDPSSGAYQAQKAQWDQALATALAGAKTRARNSGLKEQITALAQGLGVGSDLTQAGAQVGSTGVNAMTNAGSLLNNAANVVQAQGSLYGTAGSLAGTAGNLYGTQANVYQGAGNLEVNAGQLQQAAGQLALNLNNQALDATQLLQSAYDSATQYYTTQAAGYAKNAGSSGYLAGMFNGNGYTTRNIW